MATESLKIMAVSLVDGKKFKAFAVFDGERLVVVDVSQIAGVFSSWKAPLIEEVRQRVIDGYAVLVEESGEAISQYATQYLLDSIMDDGEGKTRLQQALDSYFEMDSIGSLIIAPECQKHGLKIGAEGGVIDRKNDDKGRPFYAIDWKRFTGAHRAILLCVVVAAFEPLSERFLHAMWGKPDAEPEENPWKRMKALFGAQDIERGKELDRLREGK